jgi:SAM-dependent methyltransferase
MGGTPDSWSDYWRSGRGASCFEGSDLEVRLNRAWDEFVDAMPDGARVLDLATGNGTVARICAARARLRAIGLSIDAVDAAAIDPPRVVADPDGLFRDIRFHSGIRLEALPFSAAAFDGIVSQFGFEYADEERAAAEVVRCLAPGGRLRFLLHAREGAVARDSAIRLERLKRVMAENGPLELVRTLARAAEAGDRATVAGKSTLLPAAMAELRRLAERPPPDDAALFYSNEFLKLWAERHRYRIQGVRRSIEDGWANARGVAGRQEEMLSAARSAGDMAGLADRFAGAGLTVGDVRTLRDERNGQQIGWQLDAQRARDGSTAR